MTLKTWAIVSSFIHDIFNYILILIFRLIIIIKNNEFATFVIIEKTNLMWIKCNLFL